MVAALVAFHGCTIPAEDIVDAFTLGMRGTNLAEMARVLEGVGFRATGFHATYAGIAEVTLPVIAHLQPRVGRGLGRLGMGHFVVVAAWSPRRVVVLDPATGSRHGGVRELSASEFGARWSGYLLTCEKP